ncbi:hypothetical protein EAX61_10465 [Dokdonia sinensis]|uniref:Uncharacterized protein n=1 Tax=Dokdonia sinensis TaxID=2479847 RepID=A0A3M0G8S6_9FLAO|nr:hypothetical protein [Dokdonia sinensis]RMB58033.1 hypothetical protein EAX61_10465 [Dokdonia sinensis]
MRYGFILLFILFTTVLSAQEVRTKKVVVRDSVVLDSVSINPARFRVSATDSTLIDSSRYTIDYARSIFKLKAKTSETPDTLLFQYTVYPDFLTREYAFYSRDRIVQNKGIRNRLYSINGAQNSPTFTPFEGLNTSGSIVRGVTVGNNQNSTLNSELDLQISGKLNDKVTLRASLQDSNIPQQEGGYSQNLDEFDQIFIELFSDNWNIRAGDINLVNNDSYFGSFTKKIQGLSLSGDLNHSENGKTNLFATGALVRGVFTQSNFVGQEGNQGPYKLTGPNGELFVLVISGSERVYVNGILLERGETEDYIIDYNAGEIRFNSTYPITSEMRIQVEFQFSERRYTRFVAYGGGSFTETDKFQIGAHVYSESDLKNQPLQQNLSEEQVDVLQLAGDNMDEAIAPSAIEDTFSENKVLYRKTIVNGVEVFEFSTDPDEELFTVRFSLVGDNQGDYIISTTTTLQRTFEYVAPVNGVPQGNYAPQVQLFAPTLLQLAVVNGKYTPNEKTNIKFEASGSKNDVNLFSDLDDNDNDGFAGHLEAEQRIFTQDSTSRLTGFTNYDYIQEEFVNIEGLYNVEFNRDWNLDTSLSNANGTLLGDQSFLTSGLRFNHRKGNAVYQYQNLDFQDFYNGKRHTINANLNTEKIRAQLLGSTLKSTATNARSDFSRIYSSVIYGLKKAWVGGKFQAEDNERLIKSNDSLTPDSQRFEEYEGFVGVGDSTKVFVEVGVRFRESDSIRNNRIVPVTSSNTYFLKSQLIKNEKTSLSLFANYRTLKFEDNRPNENSLNSRLLYDQRFANDIIRWNTVFETNSGTQPQQEFTFVAVDEGQGTHTWNDYNDDGVQQLEEFEIAQFQDEADFIRVLLPNQIFVKTHQNRLSQQLTLNPQQWSGQKGLKKFLSLFYNQTSYILDKRTLRDGESFSINPFNDDEDEIGASINFRNTLFFNRGKQRYTTSYTYVSTQAKNLLSTGLQENDLTSHQLNFLHKIKESWLFNVQNELGTNESFAENFVSRNYKLDTYGVNPKISYLFGKQSRITAFYEFKNKENRIGELEELQQNNLGIAFAFADAEKLSLTGEAKYIDNTFEGSPFSPVAYQILEGLQPGTNFTWNLIAQKRLTKFLDLNVSYFGRKSENSSTIHTGNVQLKAFF